MEEVETYVNEKEVVPGEVPRLPCIVWIHANQTHRKVLVKVDLREYNFHKIAVHLLQLLFGKVSANVIRIQRFQLLRET